MESSREGYKANQEGGNESNNNVNIEKFSKASSTTSRQWSSSSSGFRNPRIVRVSTSFGGKDRHSKVCTIRGLRDRRIRLSVPTAIQLYDLQDKLGLNQPSKVIDWLLEVTKFDIDKLPPLQFPPSFSQFPHHHHHHHQQTLLPFCSGLDFGPSVRLPRPNIFQHESSTRGSASHELSLGVGTFCDTSSTFMGIHQNLMMAKSRFWDVDSMTRGKGKLEAEKGKWIKTNEEENQDGEEVGESGSGNYNNNINTQKLFPMGNHSTLLPHGFLNNNNVMSYNNYHSETSNLSLSQLGSHGLFHSQQVDPPHNGLQFQVQPSFPLPSSSSSQLLFGQSSNNQTPSSLLGTTIPFVTNSVENNDPRVQIFNHFQFINSAGSSSQGIPHHHHIPSFHSFNSSIRPFTATPFNSELLDSDNNNRNQVPDNKGSGSS